MHAGRSRDIRVASMNELSPPTPLPAEPSHAGLPAIVSDSPLAWLVRGTWLFAGVILPFFCFLISFPDGPSWQSGQWNAYAQLLLSHRSSLPQYPFLAYCMICLALLVVQPARFWHHPVVRFGIYTGVLVAAEHWLVFLVATGGDAGEIQFVVISAAAVFIPWLVYRILLLLERRFRLEVAVFVAVLFVMPLAAFFHVAIFVSLWCSTAWALATYSAVSIYLLRWSGATPFRFSLAQLLSAFGWLSAHLAAWRISFLAMLDQYARLPLSPPGGCFVCTAVAQGHARVVRSQSYVAPDGAVFRVNDQLRRLKALELLLASVSPRCHRRCRWLYDRLGPRFAALLVHPLMADLGYLALKPAEWLAWACLQVVLCGDMQRVRDLYRTPSVTVRGAG